MIPISLKIVLPRGIGPVFRSWQLATSALILCSGIGSLVLLTYKLNITYFLESATPSYVTFNPLSRRLAKSTESLIMRSLPIGMPLCPITDCWRVWASNPPKLKWRRSNKRTKSELARPGYAITNEKNNYKKRCFLIQDIINWFASNCWTSPSCSVM